MSPRGRFDHRKRGIERSRFVEAFHRGRILVEIGRILDIDIATDQNDLFAYISTAHQLPQQF